MQILVSIMLGWRSGAWKKHSSVKKLYKVYCTKILNMERSPVIQQACTHSQETNQQKEAVTRKLWAETSKDCNRLQAGVKTHQTKRWSGRELIREGEVYIIYERSRETHRWNTIGGADNCTGGKGRQRLGDKYNSQNLENILCMYMMYTIAELWMLY